MDREAHGNGDFYYFNHHREVDRAGLERTPEKPLISSSSLSSSSYSSPARPSTPPLPTNIIVGGVSYIEHRVSKMDTLAGIAIKYGVEVGDVKRINGLVTDRQMFALKTLRIPLPGRHPPSPILSNGFDNEGPSSSEQTSPSRRHSDFFESFQSLRLKSSPQRRVSAAMSTLQGYYGLKPPSQKTAPEGFEMAVYRKGGSQFLEDGPFAQNSPLSNLRLSHNRRSRSVANGFLKENGDVADNVALADAGKGDSGTRNEKWIRRRQKSEVDLSSRTPETLLKEDNSGGGGGFSSITGQSLALRPKSASRTASGADSEVGLLNVIPVGLGDSFVADSFNGVRKSSSTSSLQDQENIGSSSSSSIWPTSKWSLKPDLQALSTSAITRPIFDGLPKPITGRRNKAALD